MTLQEMLENARNKEKDIALEFDRKTEQYKVKVLENDELRRKLKAEEEDLKKQIPEEPYVEGSEWSKALEEIRVLERLLGGQDG